MEKQQDPNKSTGIAIFKGILSNKAQDTADAIVSQVLEGEASPTYVAVVLKKFAKIQEEVFKSKQVKDMFEEEFRKYLGDKGKTIEIHGAKVVVADGGFWDYSQTEDEYYHRLIAIQSQVKELIKLREKELQDKAKAWEAKTKPSIGNLGTGISFTVSWNELPSLEWEEAYAEVNTNPPVKIGGTTLRFTV